MSNKSNMLKGGSNSFYLPPTAKTIQIAKRVKQIQENYEKQHGVSVGVGKVIVWALESYFAQLAK